MPFVPHVLPRPGPGGGLRILLVVAPGLYSAAFEELLTGPPLGALVTAVERSDVALEVLESDRFDLVMVASRARPIAGANFAELVHALDPTVRVVLLGEPDDLGALREALSGPAAGFLTADMGFHEFIDGIRSVLAGKRVVGRGLESGRVARRPTGRSVL